MSDKSDHQVIDGATGLPDPTPAKTGSGKRRIDLSTLRDVRIEMAHVYRSMDAGEMEAQEGSKRVYVLGEIAKIITIADIEKRVAELEERQNLPEGRAFGHLARLNS